MKSNDNASVSTPRNDYLTDCVSFSPRSHFVQLFAAIRRSTEVYVTSRGLNFL